MTTFTDDRWAGRPAEWPAESQLFAGLPIISSTAKEASQEICLRASNPSVEGTHVHLVNAYTLALANDDAEYADVLRAGLNLPDGRPISIFSRLARHNPVLNQVRGPQFFLDAFDIGRQYGIRHYLLGSTPEVLEKLQRNLEARFPGCIIAGVESPPFRPLTDLEVAAQDKRIKQAQPHIVWVGLGTPKQDREARRIARATKLTAIAVGAAFDFAAGTLREAPRWMSYLSVEWVFRLCTEPKRLWRRYLFGNTKFVSIAVRSVIKNAQDES